MHLKRFPALASVASKFQSNTRNMHMVHSWGPIVGAFCKCQIIICKCQKSNIDEHYQLSVVDPDLELRGGGGGAVLIYLPWRPFSILVSTTWRQFAHNQIVQL